MSRFRHVRWIAAKPRATILLASFARSEDSLLIRPRQSCVDEGSNTRVGKEGAGPSRRGERLPMISKPHLWPCEQPPRVTCLEARGLAPPRSHPDCLEGRAYPSRRFSLSGEGVATSAQRQGEGEFLRASSAFFSEPGDAEDKRRQAPLLASLVRGAPVYASDSRLRHASGSHIP